MFIIEDKEEERIGWNDCSISEWKKKLFKIETFIH